MSINENKFDLDPSRFMIITYDVLFDPRLNEFQKLLFAAITGLEKGKFGYCSAGNEYFCEMFNKSKSQVIAALSKLESLGFITREIVYKTGTKEVAFRKLRTVIDRPVYDGGGPENKTTGGPENKTIIDNNIINNITISKDIGEPESSPIIDDENIDNFNNKENDDKGEVLVDDKASSETAPRKGIAPLLDINKEVFNIDTEEDLIVALNAYIKAHIGCRRLPSEEKWRKMLDTLKLYSSVELPGALGRKFVKARAITIVEKAEQGKDGAPFLEFDNIYNVQGNTNVMEPQFNLNQEFKDGY